MTTDHRFWYVQAFRSGALLWAHCPFCRKLIPSKAVLVENPNRKEIFGQRIGFEPCQHLATTIDHEKTPLLVFTDQVVTQQINLDVTGPFHLKEYWLMLKHRIFAVPCLLAAIAMAVTPPGFKAPDPQPVHNRVMIARDPWKPLPMIEIPDALNGKVKCYPWRDGWRCVWAEVGHAPAR